VKVKRIVNDMRANRPQAKVRGVEDTDKKTADTIQGLGRNIWNVSDGDTITDQAAAYQVGGGMACWRVCTDYQSDESFNQDIYLEAIPNPFCLWWDPAAQDPLKRDARDWILESKISARCTTRSTRIARRSASTGGVRRRCGLGHGRRRRRGSHCRVLVQRAVTKTLLRLVDGRVVDKDDPATKLMKPEELEMRKSAS
jgi:hypothetical protein